jgi:polysaccharide biosynthesis protein PslH
MKILQLSHKPPFPTVDGGCLAMADLARLISKSGHNLSLFSLSSSKHPFISSAFPKDLYQNVSVHRIESEPSKIGAIGALLFGINYITERFRNTSIEKELKVLLERESYEIVLLESSYTGVFLNLIRSCSNAKVILRSHNIEHLLWQKRIGQFGPAQHLMMKQWTRRFEKEEKSLWKNVDAILSISEQEQSEIEKFTSAPVYYLPSTVRFEAGTFQTPTSFYFLGAMDWEPNRQALEWFCREIWPVFQKRNPDIIFHIAGKGLKANEYVEIKGIVNHGFVPDASAFLSDQQILINPLKTGQGIRIKALEAIGKGKVIISTGAGMEGLPFSPGEHYLKADTKQEFIDQMEFAKSNREAVQDMAVKAQSVAELLFSEDILAQKLEVTFQKLLKPLGV